MGGSAQSSCDGCSLLTIAASGLVNKEPESAGSLQILRGGGGGGGGGEGGIFFIFYVF